MLFDWFTVLAQIANFLILMWLLKRFLYKPVLDAIDAREKRIADLLKEAEINQQQVEQQQSELVEKNAAFSSERDELFEQAKADIELTKQHLLDTAIHDVTEQRSQWLASLQKEQYNFGHDISQHTQQEVLHIVRKALRDLSEVELETQMTQVFIKQLEQLTPQQRPQFTENTSSELVIRSAMPLSEGNKSVLQQVISRVFSVRSALHFEVDSTLICGIEMVGNGHKLSWNIDDYLLGLEEKVSNLIETKVAQTNPHTVNTGVSGA